LLRGPFTPKIVLEAAQYLLQRHPALRLSLGPRPSKWPDVQLHFYEYDNAQELIQFKTIKKQKNQNWRELYTDIINHDDQ
jgi:hypothetical protein